LSRPYVGAFALGLLVVGWLAPVRADELPARYVEVVGDSLTRMTYEAAGGWHVDGRDGRTMHDSMWLLRRVSSRAPDAVVVALGTNDVAYNRSERVMNLDIRRSVHNTMAVPCVLFTTVTRFGTPFYNRRWRAASRRFNQALWGSGVIVIDWSAAVTEHREYLLADGVHLTDEGKVAYDELLRAAVDEHCVPDPV
jgi:lysophospholipase L1-like esterase